MSVDSQKGSKKALFSSKNKGRAVRNSGKWSKKDSQHQEGSSQSGGTQKNGGNDG